MSEKPVMRILPRWDPDEPRFIVKECEKCSDDRAFKNNKCVYNQRLGFAYSVDEIVEVLNNTDELNELHEENERLKHLIQEAYEMERTALGKSVLKQILDNVEAIK